MEPACNMRRSVVEWNVPCLESVEDRWEDQEKESLCRNAENENR